MHAVFRRLDQLYSKTFGFKASRAFGDFFFFLYHDLWDDTLKFHWLCERGFGKWGEMTKKDHLRLGRGVGMSGPWRLGIAEFRSVRVWLS